MPKSGGNGGEVMLTILGVRASILSSTSLLLLMLLLQTFLIMIMTMSSFRPHITTKVVQVDHSPNQYFNPTNTHLNLLQLLLLFQH